MYTVYVHTNKINGKKYVGITSCDVKTRWKNGYGYSEHLPIGRAIKKYGWNNFDHEVLYENLTEEDAKQIEISLIAQWKTQEDSYGYNICAGGNGVTGWHPSDETKKKISNSAKLRTGAKNSNYGHKWTDEMRKNASEKKKRENLSPETLEKMSMAARNRSGENNPFFGKTHSVKTKQLLSELRWRGVKMYDKDGTFLREFKSIKNASEEIGINKVAISNCCRGVTNSSGGYVWRYSDKCDL